MELVRHRAAGQPIIQHSTDKIKIFVVEEKLKWAFKLYDVDGSGEIDEDEMQEIFEKLCRISIGPSGENIRKGSILRRSRYHQSSFQSWSIL